MNQNNYSPHAAFPALSNLGNPIDLSQPVIAPGVQAGLQDQPSLYQLTSAMGINPTPQLPQPGPVQQYASGGVIALEGGGKVAQGPGGGLDDLIPTTIDGQRAAALSDGEFVVPADVVSMMGDGSTHAGSRRLYDLVKQIRENKTGTEEQATALPFKTILERISV